MPSPQIERKLAAIMFTDIAGYTELSAKDSTKASELLTTQRDTLKPIVEKHGGSWMKENNIPDNTHNHVGNCQPIIYQNVKSMTIYATAAFSIFSSFQSVFASW